MRLPLAFLLTVLTTAVGLKALLATDALCPPSAETRRYRELFEPSGRFDAIVLGSSHAAWGLDPRPLDTPTTRYFNHAMPSTSLPFHRAWYELYRRYHGAPKAVVYAADWTLFTGYAAKPLDEDLSYFPPGLVLETLRADPANARRKLANILRWKREVAFVQRRLGLYRYPTHVLEDAFADGFTPVTSRSFNAGRRPGPMASDYRRTAELAAFLTRLRGDGARVVLVQLPEYRPVAGAHPRENAAIRQVADAAHVPFLDFNGELASPLNDDMGAFVDFEHLNATGAERFGKRLAAELRRRGL